MYHKHLTTKLLPPNPKSIFLSWILPCLLLPQACATIPQNIPTYDIHFSVITQNPDAHRIASLEQLEREVDILNTYFVTENRKSIVKFRFKSASLYQHIQDSKCELLQLGDTQKFRLDAKLFNQCDDPQVRDKQAINIYIYDSFSKKRGFKDITSWGNANHGQPYIFIDWERLNHNIQSAEEHEMGHAFGLRHVCAIGATRQTSTNIMASAECKLGSGGKRDIGFNPDQVKIIQQHAKKIQQKLDSYKLDHEK